MFSSIVGLVIFVILFIFAVPYVFLQYGWYTLLSVYFPNLDMLATSLQFEGGPPHILGGNLWKTLYNNTATDLNTIVSTVVINYFALLGVAFIVAYISVQKNSVAEGWARAFFMLIITYLVPGYLIAYVQNKLKKSDRLPKHKSYRYWTVVLISLFFSMCIILIEYVSIQKYQSIVSFWIRKISRDHFSFSL